MKQLHSFPVISDNGSRYWVALNYEAKRQSRVSLPIKILLSLFSFYIVVHVVLALVRGSL